MLSAIQVTKNIGAGDSKTEQDEWHVDWLTTTHC